MKAFVAMAILLLFPILASQPAAATSPCMPIYIVYYSDSTWTIDLHLRGGTPPLDHVWYWSPWNGTFESISPHVGRVPTPVERVTFTDREGNRNLSASDALHVWDGNRSLTNFTIATGTGPSTLDSRLDLRLEIGYAEPCGPPVPWWYVIFLEPVGVLMVALVLVLVVLLLVLVHRRRRSRAR